MSLITKKQESFEIDYRQQPLPPVFVDTNDDIDPIVCDWLRPFDNEALIAFINQAKSTLLLAMDKLDDQKLISTLQSKADQGLRVFLCLGTEQSNTSAIDQLTSRCLVRIGTRQQGSLIIRDHNTLHKSGWLLTGAVSDTAYQVVLNNQQVDDSYRSFCKSFWEECDKEYSSNSGKKAKSINSQIVVNHNYQIKNGLTPYFDAQSTGAFIRLVSSDDALLQQLSPQSDSRTTALLSDTQSTLAEQVVEQQGQAALTEQYLPNLVQVEQTYWLLPQSFNKAQSNWALRLNKQQAEDIEQWLQKNCKQAKWQLNKHATIGQTQGKMVKFTSDIANTVACEEKHESAILPIHTSSFDDFFKADIKDLAKEQTGWSKVRLASVVEYSTERHPPYCPESTKEDTLHADWSGAQNLWKKAVDEQLAKLTNLEKQQSGVAESIRNFIGQFVLGQKQQNRKIKQQLESWTKWNSVLATSAERTEKLIELKEMADKIANNKQRTEQEISNAEVQRKWEKKKVQLSENVAKAKKRVDDARSKKAKQGSELEEKNQKTMHAARQQMVDLVGNITKVEQEKLPKEFTLSAACDFFVNKKKCEPFFKALHQADDKARKQDNKIKSQLKELETRLRNAEKQLTNAEQQLIDHGERFITPVEQADHLSQQLGIKDNRNLDIRWPSEELPENGLQLMRQGNQRYLVVVKETQLEQAKADAERLKAKLCAPAHKD
ncbi:hypothetical protein ACED51_15625 [Photobacterium swingsii]|uniref:hypothetical protein n=1 Tax=Photobacterium swingsii TaxID=680026 RepID=UPI00352FD2F7